MQSRTMASRLSGECPRVAYYVRGRASPSELAGPRRQFGLRREVPGGRPPLPPPPPVSSPAPPPFGRRKNFDKAAYRRWLYEQRGKALGNRAKRVAGLLAKNRVLDVLDHMIATGKPTSDNLQLADNMKAAGWTLVCNNGTGPLSDWKVASNNPNLSCGTVGQVPSGQIQGVQVITTTGRWVAFGFGSGTVRRMRLDMQFARSATTTARIPFGAWGFPSPQAGRSPQWDPFLLPIRQAQPTPRPIPTAQLKLRPRYWVGDPKERSGGSQPSTKLAPRMQRGSYIPVHEYVFEPAPGPAPGPNNPQPPKGPTLGVHVRRPPNRREKEKKYRGLPLAVETLIGISTESMDLIDAFFKALPKKVQRESGQQNPWDRLVVVWENLDKVSLPALVENIVTMLVEDYVFGKFGQAQGKANARLWKRFGVTLAGRLPKAYNLPRI